MVMLLHYLLIKIFDICRLQILSLSSHINLMLCQSHLPFIYGISSNIFNNPFRWFPSAFHQIGLFILLDKLQLWYNMILTLNLLLWAISSHLFIIQDFELWSHFLILLQSHTVFSVQGRSLNFSTFFIGEEYSCLEI